MKNNVQIIGIDLGRGFTKAYTEYNDIVRECIFRSVVGQGRQMDFSNYEDPIYIEVDSDDYFVGDLAEKEADNISRNSKDDKTTLTAKKLLYAALSKIAVAPKVKIMLGVPNKLFRKSVLEDIKNCYKNKTIEIYNKLDGSIKNILIEDINIYRESDAALINTVENAEDRNELTEKPLGMLTIGFRTTEFTFFDKGLKFNDKKSKTSEKGNITALDYVRKKIEDELNLTKDVFEIDSSTDYELYKEKAYENLLESIDQEIESFWINIEEMKIFLAGGTVLNFKNIPNNLSVVENAQMTTAEGLFTIGYRTFK